MDMKIRHYLFIGAAALLLAGGFFLPNAVASVTDSRQLDTLIMIDSQSFSFDSSPELGLPERIALVASPDAEIIPLKTGNVMDFDMARDKTISELARFFSGGPFRFDPSGYTVEEGSAAMVIDSTVPTLNMIVWDFVLVDRSENVVTVTVDDERGLILRLICRFASRDSYTISIGSSGTYNEAFHSTAQSLAEMMNEYYELPIALADYHFSGSIAYYKANLFAGGGRVIPMYGAVRATSFTMNERV